MLDTLLHNVKSHPAESLPHEFNINKLYEHRLCATAVVFYHIDKSVLVENRPLVKFIRDYIQDLSGVFSISPLARISMMSFPTLALLFVQKYSCPCNKKKITRWLEDISFIFFMVKTIIYSLACKMLFLPFKNKIHIFAPPCNMLNILSKPGRGVFESIFAGYVSLASPNCYPIIVYSLANYRPHVSHFWANNLYPKSLLARIYLPLKSRKCATPF